MQIIKNFAQFYYKIIFAKFKLFLGLKVCFNLYVLNINMYVCTITHFLLILGSLPLWSKCWKFWISEMPKMWALKINNYGQNVFSHKTQCGSQKFYVITNCSG